MPNKRYCVTYSYRTHFDADIVASSKKEAEDKVREVLGNVKFEGTWEINEKAKETVNK